MNSKSTRRGDLPWNFLAPREKQFLELIYQVDIEAKNLKRKQFLSKKKPYLDQKKDRKNWLFYFDSDSNQPSRLRQILFRANLLDGDTYSTLKRLEQDRLIELSDCANGVKVRLTDCGYQVVRVDAKDISESLVSGGCELSESAWCVLACACSLPMQFVSVVTGESLSSASEVGLSCENISQATLKALTLAFLPLVELYGGWVRSTEFGQVFYVEQYSYYVVRYPAIAAPTPTSSKADVIESLKRAKDLPKLVRLKRYEKSLNEAVAAIGAKGITPTVLYRLEQGQLDIPKVLSPTQLKAIRRWIEE